MDSTNSLTQLALKSQSNRNCHNFFRLKIIRAHAVSACTRDHKRCTDTRNGDNGDRNLDTDYRGLDNNDRRFGTGDRESCPVSWFD